MSLKKTLVIAVAALSATAFLGTSAQAARVKWKMHSAWGSQIPVLGSEAVRFAEDITAVSGGDFSVKFFEPGALIPANEGFDAVGKGSIEMAWSTSGYDTGKYPALAFYSAVPYGPSQSETLAWYWYGGGIELEEEVYGAHGIKPMHCMSIGPETSGWFRNEITELDQLRGMKMRFFGLGARVMQKLGVSTQLLAGGDIFPALEKGVIDATEFSMPITDIKYGFYLIAKYNFFPGWHQQTSFGNLQVNLEKYNGLSDQNKRILEVTCRSSLIRSFVETEATNPEAMLTMGSEHGVIVKRWRDDQLAVFEKAWREVLEEDAAKDPVFKKIADSYLAFRKKYQIWGDAQSLKATYLD